MEALYVTIPVYFPNTFHYLHLDENTSIVMSWLVPITAKEVEYIRDKGWDEFEDALENNNPDLINFLRKCMF